MTSAQLLQKIAFPLHAHAEILMEALDKAVDLITNEYCSHPEPHSEDLNTCYAQDQLKALALCSERKP